LCSRTRRIRLNKADPNQADPNQANPDPNQANPDPNQANPNQANPKSSVLPHISFSSRVLFSCRGELILTQSITCASHDAGQEII
jgi:hypothetical protein